MTPPPENKPPFLIVGQGIAGTLLAYFLLKKKQPVKVLDKRLPGETSRIAAGIVNPITGRRLVQSWRFGELFVHAKKTYSELGAFLGISVFQDKNILRALPSVFDENEWDRRSSFPENRPYFGETAGLGGYESLVAPTHAWGTLRGAAKVDLPDLTTKFRSYLFEKDFLLDEEFDFCKMETNELGVWYNGVSYRKIIFCEGAKAVENPYFKYLPHSPTKGELLLVKIPGAEVENILKNQLYIVPLKDGLFWVGSTSKIDFQGVMPTPAMRAYLGNTLKKILQVPFEIMEHQAGIRPTVADKRPLLGNHPQHPQLAIFNGLGTKGASLGPMFAEQMAGYLLGEKGLDAEVDIKRFGNTPPSV